MARTSRRPKRFDDRRDPDYADWIRHQPCCICGTHPAEAAHVRTRGAGGYDRGNLVPLCRHHHDEQHRKGYMTFVRLYGIDLVATATTLNQEYVPKDYAF